MIIFVIFRNDKVDRFEQMESMACMFAYELALSDAECNEINIWPLVDVLELPKDNKLRKNTLEELVNYHG